MCPQAPSSLVQVQTLEEPELELKFSSMWFSIQYRSNTYETHSWGMGFLWVEYPDPDPDPTAPYPEPAGFTIPLPIPRYWGS